MILLEIFQAAEAWAAAGGAEHHAPSIHEIWFPLANFLIFAYLIKRFALPRIQDHFKTRREGVLTSLREADEKKKRAEAMVRDYRERLARLSEEVKQIQDSLRTEGELEKTKLLSEAQTLGSRIREDAQFLAEQEVKAARRKIREEMAERARAGAAELLRRHLSAADQSRLVEEFVRRIGQAR